MNRRLRSALAAQPPPTYPGGPASAGDPVAWRRSIGEPVNLAGPTGPQPAAMPAPLVLDLVAALVQGGAPPPAALHSVAAALQSAADPRADELLNAAARVGLAGARRPGAGRELPASRGRAVWERAAGKEFGTGREPGALRDTGAVREAGGRLTAVLEDTFWLAAQSGLPPTGLIRRAAAEERRRQRAAQARAVRRLEVLLIVPAGLCLLPAFVLLGIVPVVLNLIFG